ncbi:MAG: hypothetical protein ACRDP6_34410 [Actinoallomurus sp.]
MAEAVAGAAFAGLTALAIGTAAPAGAQPIQPANHTVSAAPQHAAVNQSCWGDDCWDDWGDGGWDDWGGGWNGWGGW